MSLANYTQPELEALTAQERWAFCKAVDHARIANNRRAVRYRRALNDLVVALGDQDGSDADHARLLDAHNAAVALLNEDAE
jgi:hypothetical protein